MYAKEGASGGSVIGETRKDTMMRCFLIQYEIPVVWQHGLSTTMFVLNSLVYPKLWPPKTAFNPRMPYCGQLASFGWLGASC